MLGYTCTCPAGFAGDRCEVDVDDCAVQPCAHGGACVDRVNAFTCQCTPGYQGATCAGCAIGLADCDGDVSNGCELPDTSDILNCGACGHVCPAFLSGPVCSGGVCDFAPLAQCNTVVCDANGENCQTTPVANGTTFVRFENRYCVSSFGGLCLKTQVDTETCTCQHGTATSCETVVKFCLLGSAC